jgi:hypothetical protein
MSDYGQTIFVISFFVVIALTFVFSTYIYQEIKDPLNNSTFATNQSRAAYNKFTTAWPIFDKAAIFILIAMMAGVLISAFTIPTHPIYVIGNMLIMAVEVFVSFVLANAYKGIVSVDPSLLTIAQVTYPYTSYIVLHLPIFAIALSTLNCIVMFSHGRRTETYGY